MNRLFGLLLFWMFFGNSLTLAKSPTFASPQVIKEQVEYCKNFLGNQNLPASQNELLLLCSNQLAIKKISISVSPQNHNSSSASLEDILIFPVTAIYGGISGIGKAATWILGSKGDRSKLVSGMLADELLKIDSIKEILRPSDRAPDYSIRQSAETLAREITSEVLNKTKGGLPSEEDFYKPTTLIIGRMALNKALRNMGYSSSQLDSIIDTALDPVKKCFDDSTQSAKKCSELFSNGAPFLVTRALLNYELKQKLGSTLDPNTLKDFGVLAENILAQCTADKYNNKDSLEVRTQTSQSCLFYTFTKLFPDIAKAVIFSKLKTMNPELTHLKTETEIETYSKNLVDDFLAYRSQHQNPKCAIDSSELKDYQNLKPQADFWRLLTQCSPQGFLNSVGTWTDDISDFVGEKLVTRVIQKHNSIPAKLKTTEGLKTDIVNKIVELSYAECRKLQKESSPNSAFNPDKCTSGIETVTKLVVSTEAVLAELSSRYSNNSSTDWKSVHSQSSDIYSKCSPRIMRESLAYPITKSHDMNHFLVHKSATRCLSAALKPIFEQFGEQALISKITDNPDLARYFPKDLSEIRAALNSSGILSKVRSLTSSCMLDGLDSFSLDSLQSFLKMKQDFCALYIEDSIAPLLAKEINKSLFDSLVPIDSQDRETRLRNFNHEVSPHVREFESIGTKASNAHNSQFFERFGLSQFPRFNSPTEESDYLNELTNRTNAYVKNAATQSFKNRSKYKESLMLEVTRYAIKDQLATQFANSNSHNPSEEIYNKIDAQVVELLKEIKSVQNQILDTESKGHNAKALKQILKKLEVEFEAQVRNVATRAILEHKIRDTITSKSPQDADAVTNKIMAQYDECIAIYLSDNNFALIKPKFRMSQPKDSLSELMYFQAEQVDRCRNNAIVQTTFTTLSLVVDKTLKEHLSDRYEGLEKVPHPQKCPILINSGSTLELHLASFKCQEKELKKCFEQNSTSKKVTEICVSKSVFEVSRQMAGLVLESNLKKYIGSSNLELFNKVDIWGSLNSCMDKVKNSTNTNEIEKHTDSCVAVEIIRIANTAAEYSSSQYAELQNKTRKNASEQAWQDFTKCYNNTVSELTGQSPAPAKDKWANIFRQKNISSQTVKLKISSCGEKLASLIQDNVMSSFKSTDTAQLGRLHSELKLNSLEIMESSQRVKKGLDEMSHVLTTLNKYSSKKGAAAPAKDVKESLELLGSLVTEACVFDPECIDKIKQLERVVERTGSKTGHIDSAKFKNLLLNSPLFDSVILARIQSGLRNSLTKELKPKTSKEDAPFVDEMIRYLSSHSYLSQRFQAKQSIDRHGQNIKGSRSLLDNTKNELKEYFLNNNKAFDPSAPEFTQRLTKEIKKFLVDDWEFLAGLFYSFAQAQIKQSDFPWYATPVAWWKGWNKEQEFDWFNKVSRTQAGCSIIKKIRFYVQECFDGREMPILNKESFVKLYEEGVSQSLDKQYINIETCLNKVRDKESSDTLNKTKSH